MWCCNEWMVQLQRCFHGSHNHSRNIPSWNLDPMSSCWRSKWHCNHNNSTNVHNRNAAGRTTKCFLSASFISVQWEPWSSAAWLCLQSTCKKYTKANKIKSTFGPDQTSQPEDFPDVNTLYTFIWNVVRQPSQISLQRTIQWITGRNIHTKQANNAPLHCQTLYTAGSFIPPAAGKNNMIQDLKRTWEQEGSRTE